MVSTPRPKEASAIGTYGPYHLLQGMLGEEGETTASGRWEPGASFSHSANIGHDLGVRWEGSEGHGGEDQVLGSFPTFLHAISRDPEASTMDLPHCLPSLL